MPKPSLRSEKNFFVNWKRVLLFCANSFRNATHRFAATLMRSKQLRNFCSFGCHRETALTGRIAATNARTRLDITDEYHTRKHNRLWGRTPFPRNIADELQIILSTRGPVMRFNKRARFLHKGAQFLVRHQPVYRRSSHRNQDRGASISAALFMIARLLHSCR